MSRARSRIRTKSGREIYCEEDYDTMKGRYNSAKDEDDLVECQGAKGYEKGVGKTSIRASDIESIEEWKGEETKKED